MSANKKVEKPAGKIVIVITGTPGTGKTSVSRKLVEKINGLHIDVSRYVIDNRIYIGYDEYRRSYIIDEEKLVEKLESIIRESNKPVVIDIHYPEILDPNMVDYVIILRTNPLELEKRLSRRKDWPLYKIRENVMAEILGVVTSNVLEHYPEEKVYEIDTTSKNIEEIVREIIAIIRGKRKISVKKWIDWLELISPRILDKYGEY